MTTIISTVLLTSLFSGMAVSAVSDDASGSSSGAVSDTVETAKALKAISNRQSALKTGSYLFPFVDDSKISTVYYTDEDAFTFYDGLTLQGLLDECPYFEIKSLSQSKSSVIGDSTPVYQVHTGDSDREIEVLGKKIIIPYELVFNVELQLDGKSVTGDLDESLFDSYKVVKIQLSNFTSLKNDVTTALAFGPSIKTGMPVDEVDELLGVVGTQTQKPADELDIAVKTLEAYGKSSDYIEKYIAENRDKIGLVDNLNTYTKLYKGNTLTLSIIYVAGNVQTIELFINDTGAVTGDSDLDGEVGVLDVVALQRYMLNASDVTIGYVQSDLNNDKTIDVFDLALLKREIVG